MTTLHAMMVTPAFTIMDNPADLEAGVVPTPSGLWSAGFGALLDRVARKVSGEAVVLLDRAAAHALKLPAGPDEATTVGVDDARAAGWLSGKLSGWTRFYGEGRPSIVVGLPDWPQLERCPLVDPGVPTTEPSRVYRLALWQRASGHAWCGTPGVMAMNLLRATAPEWPVRGRPVTPSWSYRAGPDRSEAAELDFEPEDWSRPQEARYAHGYDARRMYLAAAGACEKLAPWSLRHSGRIDFSPNLAGWWKVKLGPWAHDRIPAPAGPGDDVRWVTTPTLILLQELIDRGEHFQDFEVLDSWTGDGKRILRRWAETIECAYQAGRDEERRAVAAGQPFWAEAGDAVAQAAKLVYKEGWGILNYVSEDGRPNAIFRPDWHYAILAQARSNLWRRMWAVGNREGRWPIEIKVDNVWYESDEADPERAVPVGIPLVDKQGRTDRLGTFKPKGTRERQAPK